MRDIGLTFTNEDADGCSLSINPVEFFKGTTKALIKTLAGGYTDAVGELPDIAASLGFGASPQKRVGLLIVRTLERALLTLVSELVKDRDGIAPNVHAASFTGISKNLKFQIDSKFFANPSSTGIVDLITPDAKRWMDIIGISENDASNIVDRLPSIFVRCLHEEWTSNVSYYSEILEATNSPFVEAATMEQDWSRYRAYLGALSEERVFDESFGLRQIYISPRCYFFEKSSQSDRTGGFSTSKHQQHEEPRKKLRWARAELESWIGSQDKDFAIRTIAGGPGSGKSSFAKILASDLARQNKHVLFVPLHQVDLELGIAKSLADYFTQSGLFSHDPLATLPSDITILILDGLDEIQMQGRAAQESAQSFVADLTRFIDRKNNVSCKILCLLTGRDLAIQSAEGSLKIESQILHLAPYSMQSEVKSSFDDDLDIFDIDQRDEWWSRYGQLTSLPYTSMPNTLRTGEINEVTAQPLLNYLVALSYQRGLHVDETTNINNVYEDLLKAVYNRAWARHSHPSVQDVSYDSFVRLLEEVALSVWHGAGRTTTLAEVEAHCQQSRVGSLLPSFQSGVSSGVSSLLLAFYFRQKGRRDDGSKTFEFTHKTFAEYLTCLRVVRLIKLIAGQMAAHEVNPDEGIDELDALYRWLSICGKTPVDTYLLEFIRREIQSVGSTNAANLQDYLIKMYNYSLQAGWPIQRIEKLTFTEQISYVRNSEETLLCCINACALTSNIMSTISWPSETSAGDMIRRLQGQRRGPSNRPIMRCLSHSKYEHQSFDMADLYGANLRNCSLQDCELNYTNLMSADLSNSTFQGADLYNTNLSETKLTNTKFELTQILRVLYGIVENGFLRSEQVGERLLYPFPKSTRGWMIFMEQSGMIVVDEEDQLLDRQEVEKYLSQFLSPKTDNKSRKKNDSRETGKAENRK